MVRFSFPWETSYQDDVSWDAALDIKPVGAYLAEAAQRWPTKAALIFGDESYTYSELWASAERAARAFAGLGVRSGVNVGVLFPNCPHHSIMCFGVLLAGGTVVNLSAEASSRNLEDQLAQTGAVLLVSTADLLRTRKIQDVIGGTEVGTIVVVGQRGGHEQFPEHVVQLDSELFQARAIDRLTETTANLDQIALIQFTGGTTGVPKGAILSHRNVSSSIEIVRCWLGSIFTEPDRKCAMVLPTSHVFGLVAFLSCIATGTPIYLYATFDPLSIIIEIEDREVSIFFGVPAMYSAMLSTSKLSHEVMRSIKICVAGGDSLSSKLEQSFRKATNITIREGYGMTETSAIAVWQPSRWATRPEATGLPLPRTTIEIVDLDTGERVLGQGEVGEVCISGPQVMAGYWNQPEETAWAFRGGRFHTGDIGLIDEHGYLKLVDRKKNMILTGGFNVFPSAVEAALRQHPTVLDTVVVGLSNAYMGQLVKAFLKPCPGFDPCGDEDLIDFLSERLASHEIPMIFEWRDKFPQTKIGKIDRKLLQDS